MSERCELVEWRICRPQKAQRAFGGGWVFHAEGAQSIFGLSRARKILRELKRNGDGHKNHCWEIRHAMSFEPAPINHEVSHDESSR